MKKFFKKNWSNLILLCLIIFLILPGTRELILVGFNRLIAFEPETISEEKREVLKDYDWELVTLSGERMNFSEAKGKVIILNFWATWCPPCIAEMPSLQTLYEEFGEKVEFFFISQEETEVLRQFMINRNYSFPVMKPLSGPPGLLSSDVLPTTYIISSEGEIIVRKEGAADWDDPDFIKFLEDLLRKEKN